MVASHNLIFRLCEIQIIDVGWSMEQLDGIAFWLAIAATLFPIWGALIWEIWEGIVPPRRLPQTEIDALTRQMIVKHGQQAPGAAFTREYRAWRTSDSFEQAKWRRVRLRICRMASWPCRPPFSGTTHTGLSLRAEYPPYPKF